MLTFTALRHYKYLHVLLISKQVNLIHPFKLPKYINQLCVKLVEVTMNNEYELHENVNLYAPDNASHSNF